ncbi:MAG: flagellar biosynthetic protein FliR [Chloroflexi bacterium]|nr:flagellar biosynthetic protein FliR [Chloroflexota bacterium]
MGSLTTPYLMVYFLVFVRTLTLYTSMPVVSSRVVPVPAKIGLGLLTAFALLPDGRALPVVSGELLPYATAIAQEILAGLVLGFGAQLVFVVMENAAALTGTHTGFGAANAVLHVADFTGNPLSQFYFLFAALLFLVVDGHHQLLIGLDASLQAMPVGTFQLGEATTERLLMLLSTTWVAALRISLPVMGALLAADLALALVSRAVPQMNVFYVGAPLKVGLGLIMLAITLPTIAPVFRSMVGTLAQQSATLLKAVP